MRLRFLAEPHHVLRAGGEPVQGGQELEVDDEVGEALLAAPWVDVERVDEKPARRRGSQEEE